MPKTEAENKALVAFLKRNNMFDYIWDLTKEESSRKYPKRANWVPTSAKIVELDLRVFLGAQSGSQFRGWTLPGADPLQPYPAPFEKSVVNGVWIWEDGTSFEDITEKEDNGRGNSDAAGRPHGGRHAGTEQYRSWPGFQKWDLTTGIDALGGA